MKMHLALMGMVAAGCGNPIETTSNGRDGAPAKVATTGTTGTTGTATAESKSASSGTPEDCPKSLVGLDEATRVIRKDCGPITVSGAYDLEGSLTLEAGAVLRFADGAELDVGMTRPARLIVKGTERDPVVFTSAGDPVAGAWKGVRLYKNAERPELSGLVIENAGDEKGALYVEADAVTLRGSTVRGVRDVGVFVDSRGRFADLSGNRFERAGKVALSIPPSVIGSVGPNRFDEGAFVQVRGGTVDSDARWQAPGAPFVVAEDVAIDGKSGRATVEIVAGTELRFRSGVGLELGGNTDGALVVSGTDAKPVLFTAADARKPGAWKGVAIHGKASARIAGASFSFGGSDGKGVLRLDGGSVTVSGSTFVDDRSALSVDDDGTLESFEKNRIGGSPDPAVVLVADQVGGLGSGNRYESGARIEVTGGSIKRSATWSPQGVPYEITGETLVGDKATLTLAAGAELAFKDEQALGIGYYSDGTLAAIGTAEQPVRMHGLKKDTLWKGLTLYGHALGCELVHLELTNVDGDAGVVVAKDATARVADVTCVGCVAATLTSECGAKLKAVGIRAGAGTPKAELKPDCE